MMNRLIVLKLVIILSCVCFSMCSLTFGKRERKVLTVDMWTKDKVYVDDVYDDVEIRLRRHVHGRRGSDKISTELFSGALKYATQTFQFDVKAIGDKTCITVGERLHSGETSADLPGLPGVGEFCGMDSFPDTMWTYNSSRPFVVETTIPYADSLWFSVRVNMHAEDKDGNSFVSGVSRRITVTDELLASVTVINLRDKCGEYVMLDNADVYIPDRKPPRPVLLYYDQGIYGDADCTVRFLTNFREFHRMELQFIEYREINGFCIDAGGHSYCGGKRPSLDKPIDNADKDPSHYKLKIYGNGSAFFHLKAIITQYHVGGYCYDLVCKTKRCVPEFNKCKGLNPCGDYSDCPRHLTGAQVIGVLCAVVTAIAILKDVYDVTKEHKVYQAFLDKVKPRSVNESTRLCETSQSQSPQINEMKPPKTREMTPPESCEMTPPDTYEIKARETSADRITSPTGSSPDMHVVL